MDTRTLCIIVVLAVSSVYSHVDDVFYLESTTSSFVTVAWFGEEDAVDHVKEWKIYIDDEEKHDGTPNELIQNAQLRIGDLNSGPGEDVKVTVTATKTDGSVVHPLLNYYCRLKPLPVQNIELKQEETVNNVAGSGTLSWSPSPGSVQDGYKIRHKSTFTGPSNWSEYSETYSESYSFSGLVPGDLYRFQVVAKSGDQSGDPTEVEFELHPGHVTDVEVKSYPDGESIGLKWIKPPGIISYMEVFVEPYQKDIQDRGNGETDVREDGANIYSLSPGYTYILHICAVGTKGTKGRSVDVAVTTVPDINSPMTLGGPAGDTSATIIYANTYAKFDFYHIKLNTNEKERPYFDKQKSDPHRSVTFLDLVPGTYYEVLLYTVVERTAGAERVSSQPFQFSFETAGSSDNRDVPLAVVIALAVVIGILLMIIIIISVFIYKWKRQQPSEVSKPTGAINNNVNLHTEQGNTNRLRYQESVNTSGPQPPAQTTSYLELSDGRGACAIYDQPVIPSFPRDDKWYESLKHGDHAEHNHDNKAYIRSNSCEDKEIKN